jgi:DNA-binding HxlR family transcriptional regulator
VDYELTDLGGALLPVVQSVEAWAEAWTARTK